MNAQEAKQKALQIKQELEKQAAVIRAQEAAQLEITRAANAKYALEVTLPLVMEDIYKTVARGLTETQVFVSSDWDSALVVKDKLLQQGYTVVVDKTSREFYDGYWTGGDIYLKISW